MTTSGVTVSGPKLKMEARLIPLSFQRYARLPWGAGGCGGVAVAAGLVGTTGMGEGGRGVGARVDVGAVVGEGGDVGEGGTGVGSGVDVGAVVGEGGSVVGAKVGGCVAGGVGNSVGGALHAVAPTLRMTSETSRLAESLRIRSLLSTRVVTRLVDS